MGVGEETTRLKIRHQTKAKVKVEIKKKERNIFLSSQPDLIYEDAC
jgi:hypothetical protein